MPNYVDIFLQKGYSLADIINGEIIARQASDLINSETLRQELFILQSVLKDVMNTYELSNLLSNQSRAAFSVTVTITDLTQPAGSIACCLLRKGETYSGFHYHVWRMRDSEDASTDELLIRFWNGKSTQHGLSKIDVDKIYYWFKHPQILPKPQPVVLSPRKRSRHVEVDDPIALAVLAEEACEQTTPAPWR